jgi:hypothetical protein
VFIGHDAEFNAVPSGLFRRYSNERETVAVYDQPHIVSPPIRAHGRGEFGIAYMLERDSGAVVGMGFTFRK